MEGRKIEAQLVDILSDLLEESVLTGWSVCNSKITSKNFDNGQKSHCGTKMTYIGDFIFSLLSFFHQVYSVSFGMLY